MLLWQDSLHFPTGSNMPSQMYPGQSGMAIQALGGRNYVSITNGTFKPPTQQPTGFGSEKITIGLRLRVDQLSLATPTDNTSLIEIRDSGGVPKMKIKLRTADTGYWFEAQVSDSSLLLLRSPSLKYGEWNFVEFQVVFSPSQGTVVIRTDGTVIARSENLNTDPNPVQAWRSVQFIFGAPPLQFKISDLYITDGTGPNKTFKTFLGPVSGKRILSRQVSSSEMGWAFSPNPKRLIWILGQSNAHGLGLLTDIHAPWRSPNPLIKIWSTRTGPSPQFEPLTAGVNTWGHMYGPGIPVQPWFGAEMQFAERISQLFDKMPAGITTSNVAFVKTVFDASNVDSWLPGSIDGFSAAAIATFSQAVTALGGPSTIRDVTIIWYQGESNLLAGDLPFLYANKLKTVLQALQGSLGSIPSRILLTRLHPYSNLGIPGINYIEEVRKHDVALEIVSKDFPNSQIISTEGLFLRDAVHLTSPALDILGDRYFEAWFKNLNPAGDLRGIETLTNPPDSTLWVGSEIGGLMSMSPEILLGQGFLNGPLLASTTRHHLQTVAAGTLETLLGTRSLQSTLLSSSLPQWSFVHLNHEGTLLPEEAMNRLAMKWVP